MTILHGVERAIPVELVVLILRPHDLSAADSLAVCLRRFRELRVVVLEDPLPRVARLAQTLRPEAAAIELDFR